MMTLKLALSFVMIILHVAVIITLIKKIDSPWKWIMIVVSSIGIIIYILYINLLLGRMA